MVVFFPPSTYTRRRDYTDYSDDDEAGARYYYVRLEPVSSSDEEEEEDDNDDDEEEPTARGRRRRGNHRHAARLILEVPDDEEEEDEESDEWNPFLHLGELPLRPMNRVHKAFIDVFFVVATVALEGGFVWALLQQDGADKVINWFLAAPLVLFAMFLILCLAAYLYVLITLDFSWRPPPAPADEKV